jgi:CRP/FNR family transcriptional regulator, anaerobic regulatory protein
MHATQLHLAAATHARNSILARAFAAQGLRGHVANRPVETLAANEALFWEGDPADSVFEIVSGVLRLSRLLADGRRAIVGFLYAGEMLGLPCRDGYAYTAEAVTTLKVRRLSRPQVLRLVDESPVVRRDLLALAYDEMCSAQDQMLLLGRKTAEERVASFLLQVARRCAGNGATASEIILPMTRLDMADFLGLTIETVSRLMSKLKGDGIIALPSPSRVLVMDEAALHALAGQEAPEPALPQRVTTVHAAAWPH